MKIENIISIYKIKTNNIALAEISEKLPKNYEDKNPEEVATIVKKVVAELTLSELDKDKALSELDKYSKCSICHMPGELLTLDRNRPIFRCKKHNTINPIPVELIKKFGYDYEPTK